MKVREERVLADRRRAKSGGQVDELLAACWEETLDAGPYDLGDKPIDWGLVLQGDRFYALPATFPWTTRKPIAPASAAAEPTNSPVRSHHIPTRARLGRRRPLNPALKPGALLASTALVV
jgi:hypothetical protein